MGRYDPAIERRYNRTGADGNRVRQPVLASAAVTVFIVVAIVTTSSAGAQQDYPAAVINAYEAARDRGEMDAAMTLFADDAVVVDSAGAIHHGRQQIRILLQTGANPDWSVGVSNPTVNGDHVFWTERVGSRYSKILQPRSNCPGWLDQGAGV